MAWDDTIITNTTSISPLPKSPFLVLQNPNWNNAMHDEYNALVKNGTWILVPRPAGINFVQSMWLFKHKFHADGSLSRYKACLFANGSSQQLGIDCDETFIDTDSKLGPEGVPVQDPTLYHSLPGGLQYLTFTRPDISYAVQQICLYMHDPREPHLAALKRILCYIRGTLDFGFHLYSSTTISLVGYTNMDWASCLSTRRAEAQNRGVANVIAETTWLRNLLRELHSPLSAATIVYYDMFSATYQAINEDDRLARAINGLCDGLTMAIEEKDKYILPLLQRRW
nr:ribonuclease H-like domain-containing protein [Tanacetum cinerariifolium]